MSPLAQPSSAGSPTGGPYPGLKPIGLQGFPVVNRPVAGEPFTLDWLNLRIPDLGFRLALTPD